MQVECEYVYTPKEVADALRITESAVRDQCERNALPAIQVGKKGRWLIRRDFIAVLEARRMDLMEERARRRGLVKSAKRYGHGRA